MLAQQLIKQISDSIESEKTIILKMKNDGVSAEDIRAYVNKFRSDTLKSITTYNNPSLDFTSNSKVRMAVMTTITPMLTALALV